MGFPKSAKRAAARVVFRSNGGTVGGVSAEAALDELTRIHASETGLTAKAVVDESRPEDAVLHPAFEWNDSKAAEQFREHQATSLIRSVRVVVPPSDEDVEITPVTITQPAFINVSPHGTAGSYQPPERVVENVNYLAVATENAARHLRAAQLALEDLKAIAQGRDDERATLVVAAIASLEVAREAVSKFH